MIGTKKSQIFYKYRIELRTRATGFIEASGSAGSENRFFISISQIIIIHFVEYILNIIATLENTHYILSKTTNLRKI